MNVKTIIAPSKINWVIPLVCLLLCACSSKARAPQGIRLQHGEVAATRIPTVGGAGVALADYRGRLILLHFWASWCIPCVTELSELQSFSKRFDARDLVVLGVAIESGKAAVKAVTAERRITFPVVLDNDLILQRAFEITGVPTTLLLDVSGRQTKIIDPQGIVAKNMISGPRGWNQPSTIDAYRKLITQD